MRARFRCVATVLTSRSYSKRATQRACKNAINCRHGSGLEAAHTLCATRTQPHIFYARGRPTREGADGRRHAPDLAPRPPHPRLVLSACGGSAEISSGSWPSPPIRRPDPRMTALGAESRTVQRVERAANGGGIDQTVRFGSCGPRASPLELSQRIPVATASSVGRRATPSRVPGRSNPTARLGVRGARRPLPIRRDPPEVCRWTPEPRAVTRHTTGSDHAVNVQGTPAPADRSST